MQEGLGFKCMFGDMKEVVYLKDSDKFIERVLLDLMDEVVYNFINSYKGE